MAIGAVLGDIGMFVDERPLVFHVATGTGRLDRDAFQIEWVSRIVRIVAVRAGHLLLGHRMVGELAEFHLDLLVTPFAHELLIAAAGLLLRPHVQLVAGKAADVVHGVDVAIPVGQIRGRSRRVALQAKHRLGRGGELVEREQCFKIAGQFFVNIGNRQAPRTVARFTIDQWQASFRRNLITMDRKLEILGDLVMLMTLLQAIFVTDVIGFEVADQEGFVILNGGDRPAGP